MLDHRLLGLILVFSPLSLLSFGGGQAVIPEVQHQAVTVHGWLSNDEFADLFAISRAAPGPSSLIAALIGWRVSGFLGAVVATLGIFVPSSVVVYAVGAWWQRNSRSMIRKVIERGLAPVAVGLIFAGAATVLKAAHAGPLELATAAAVCALSTLSKMNTYAIMGAVAAGYLVLYAALPVLAG